MGGKDSSGGRVFRTGAARRQARAKPATRKAAPARRKAARTKRPRRGGIIGFFAGLARWIWRLIWTITWRVSLVVFLVLALAVGYIYTTIPPLEALLDGRARGSVTMLDREGEVFAWRGDQFGGVVTAEDGIIGTRCTGVRGFASLVLSAASDSGTRTEHVGIVDPRIAPSEGHAEVWEHFGLTSGAIADAVKSFD